MSNDQVELTTHTTDDAVLAEPGTGRAPRIVETGLAVFGATTGALLAFAYQRGGALRPFAMVGRRVARDIAVSSTGDALIGFVVHLGHSLALAAAAVLLRDVLNTRSRFRAALLVTLAWQLATIVPWLSVIRVDMALALSTFARAGLALLLFGALTLGTRK